MLYRFLDELPEPLQASCSVELRYGLAAHTPAATSYTAASMPDGLSLNEGTGELTWTPVRAQAGSHELTVKVTDAHGRSSELPVTIDVSCPEPLTVGCTAVPASTLSPLLLLLLALRRRR